LHVAVIMDGGGYRPAQRGLARIAGYHHGAEAAWKTVNAALTADVTHLTLIGVASDSPNRETSGAKLFLHLLHSRIDKHRYELQSEGIRLSVIGDRTAWAPHIAESIEQAEKATRNNTRMRLTFVLNHGARADIAGATRRLAFLVQDGMLQPDEIDQETFAANLGTGFLPDLDLLIRTSGEQRVGDFLLWQVAYAEMLFVEKSWQDFTGEDLTAALSEFKRRQRRFGATG